jgi:sarcosine oxidase gamma subunit
MLDHGKKWPEPVMWDGARVDVDGLSVVSKPGLAQHYVSGDLDGFLTKHLLAAPIGLLGQASGERYTVRMARDRMLVVGIGDDELVTGWDDVGGCGITRMSSALHVFEIAGPRALELLARGCVFDPANAGPCSTIQFAGVTVSLYRYGGSDFVRLHIDRGLASYLWSWINAQGMVLKPEVVASP